MKRSRLANFVAAALAGLIILLGVGPDHALLPQRFMLSHGTTSGESTKQCQSICPPLFTEKQKMPGMQDEEAEPDPFPAALAPTERSIALAYLVAFAALMLLYMRRRPPDLVIQYATLRN